MVLIVVSIIEYAPSIYLKSFEIQNIDVPYFSDVESVQNNGRLSMVLYWEAKRRQAISELREMSVQDDLESPVRLSKIDQKKNIHLIVMESLFDPSHMKNVVFSRDPMFPELRKILKKQPLRWDLF